jgi:hypothetical protein
MDINELESFELADAVKFHDKLNPVLWDEGNRMRPEVREALLKIAQDFQEFMGIGDFALEDITVSGSNAAYSYTPHSDIDLHLIVDQSKLTPGEVYKELFNAKKYQYNDQHDFKIKGYDVEVYVQDSNQPHESLGVYSVLNDDWNRIPTARRANLDEPTTQAKYEKLGHVIEKALGSSDFDYVSRVLDTVKKYRKAGLDEKGEFGPENLAFKALRKSGLVQQLWDHRANLKDRQLSLKEKAKAPRKTWGKFNGMAFESDELEVDHKIVNLEEEVEKFVKYAAKFLKLKRLPKILLRGPEFSHEIHSFGHYVDDKKMIEVETENRQIMDILRTLAHEMVHFRQHETQHVPADAGETGSKFENEAHAVGGVIMRHWQNKHPELLQAKTIADTDNIDEGRLGKAAAAAALGTAVAAGSPPAKADFVSDIANTARAVYNAPKNYTKASIQGEIGQELQNFVRAQGGDAGAQNRSHFAGGRRAQQSTAAAGGEGSSMSDAVAAAERNAARQLGTNDYQVIEREVQPMGGGQFRAMVVVRPVVREASGYIPTKAQAKDPRFKTALTVDVKPGQIGKEANKLKLNVDSQGHPDLLMKSLRNALKEGLDVKTFTPKELAYKHGVSEKQILAQLKKGIKIEQEHTTDAATAREIALDHLLEFPDYYDRLEQAEQQLNEVKMSPSALKSFAKTPEAQGIRIGFEAEIIFPGLGGSGDDAEYEPDYDMDERATSIDDVINFFEYDDYGYGISGREADRLRESLEEEFWEYLDNEMMSEFNSQAFELVRDYIERNEWDQDEQIREYLSVESGLNADEIDEMIAAAHKATNSRQLSPEYVEARKAVDEELDARAELSVDDQDEFYNAALDEFRDGYDGLRDEEEWLRLNYRYMSDIENAFGLTWPYIREEGGDEDGYNEYEADRLADEMSEQLGVKTKASSGYHSTRRDESTWIFEPDSSLNADSGDMPVEIISPPMPLEQGLTKMREFFDWAASHDAYTNDSTGFHMGVSIPLKGGKVDFLKLALFLGDEHVLKEFGRQANHFTEAAMKKIRAKIKNNPGELDNAMTLMRNGLIELANKSLSNIVGSEKSPGFGKYTSINPKGNYIEFRSAGGEEYNKDIDKLENTLLRYARAMTIAGNPAAERREYYKKLYKLISPKGNTALDLFAKYASGNLSAEELKKQWAEEALSKDAPQELDKSTWRVYDKAAGKYLPGYSYSGYTEQQAMALVKQAMSPGDTPFTFKKMFDQRYELRNVSKSTGRWAIVDQETGETLDVVDSENRGDAADYAQEHFADKIYYIEPVPTGEKPKLSPRAELAKRIKSGVKPTKFKVYGDPNSPYQSKGIEVTAWDEAEAYEKAKKQWNLNTGGQSAEQWAKQNKWRVERLGTTDTSGQSDNEIYNYYIKNNSTDEIVKKFYADNQDEAYRVLGAYRSENPPGGNFVVGMTKFLDGSERTATPEPAQTSTGNQQWKVINARTGDSTIILAPSRLRANAMVMDLARRMGADADDFTIEPYTPAPAPAAQQQQTPPATTPVERRNEQVTTDSGVPMWEIYDRRTGNALTRFPDHNQTAAWSTARQWLQYAHMPEQNWAEYSVRPLVNDPTAVR